MSVFVTGATGSLGRGVVDELRSSHELILSDLPSRPAPEHADLEYRQCDLRDPDQARAVIEPGVDVIVHTSAWHGVHAFGRTPHDFWQVNVDGTYNVFEAAHGAGVKAVTFASSQVVYGPVAHPYCFSKQAAELVVRHFRERAGIRVVCLRYANFTPHRDFLDYGLRFLEGGGLDRRDAIGATAAAARRLAAGIQPDLEVDVQSESSFSAEQAERWSDDPWTVLAERFPEDADLLREYLAGHLPPGISARGADPKLRDGVGFVPRYSFATFVDELRDRHRANDLSPPAGYSVAP